MKKIDKVKVWIYEKLYSYFGSRTVFHKTEGVEFKWYSCGNKWTEEIYKDYNVRRISNKLGSYLKFKIENIKNEDVLEEFKPVFNTLKPQSKFGDSMLILDTDYKLRSCFAYKNGGEQKPWPNI